MAKRSWTVELVEAPSAGQSSTQFAPRRQSHNITLNHNYWTTKRTIAVDGQPLPTTALRSYGIYSKGSDDLFVLDGHTCHIYIRPVLGGSYKYDLAIDGRSVETGAPITPWPQTLQVKTGANTSVPWWGWLFVLPMILATALGAIAGLAAIKEMTNSMPRANVLAVGLALAGFYQILAVARDRDKPTPVRVALCVGLCLLAALGAFVLELIAGALFH